MMTRIRIINFTSRRIRTDYDNLDLGGGCNEGKLSAMEIYYNELF
jgi:hypothetical protein